MHLAASRGVRDLAERRTQGWWTANRSDPDKGREQAMLPFFLHPGIVTLPGELGVSFGCVC